MTNETIKTQANDLMERGKDLVEQGNQRQVVFLSKTGSSIVEVKLSIAVGVAVVLLITGLVSLPFVAIVALVAYMMGIRADVRQTTV
ncbi:MAG: DUF4342 domain-containing protein [Chloroflexota bacterium]